MASGEYFLKRYRTICPDVEIVEPTALKQALRVNTSKVSYDDLARSLNRQGAFLKRIEWLRNGAFVHADFSLGATPTYLQGHYYLQGPLSQLTCEVLDPKSTDHVLDMAAAPGGKTTYLAQLASDGVVVALDVDARRLAAVRNNVERLGLPNVLCIKKDARFASDLKEEFDGVLLDAPCSGNFCSEEGWFAKRTIDEIRSNARVQKELLRSALLCCKPGGLILYSTCSLEPEEDELVIDWGLENLPIEVVDFDVPLGDPGTTMWDGKELKEDLAKTRRFWPHRTGFEGFYIALLRRTQ